MSSPKVPSCLVSNMSQYTRNAFVESFNGKFRDECLNQHWFVSLRHARAQIAAWRDDYNNVRPHSSLADLTPAEYAQSLTTNRLSTVQEAVS
jgi:putative transposase